MQEVALFMTNSLVDEIWWINGSVRLEFKWSLFALWWKLYGWLQFGMPLQLKAGTPLEWRLWSRLTSSDLKVSTHLQCFLLNIRRCALECPPWKRGKILLHETSKSRCKSFSFLPGCFCLVWWWRRRKHWIWQTWSPPWFLCPVPLSCPLNSSSTCM